MRTLLSVAASLAILGFGLALPARAEEPRSFDANLLPRTEQGLKDLDDKQLRIVRRSTNMCNASDPVFIQARASMRPCIIGSVDNAIKNSNDPALQAYHDALPLQARYDRWRPAYYYQQMLIKFTKPPQ